MEKSRGQFKVMYVIPSMRRGGAEVLLANQIPLLMQEGVEPVIVTTGTKDDLIQDQRLSVKHISLGLIGARNTMGALRSLCQLRARLRRVIRQERPDLVHLNLYSFDAWGRLAAHELCPTITTWHSTDPRLSSRVFRRRVIQCFERWTCRWPDSHLLAVSNNVKEYCCHNLKIPESRVTMIHNGIDLDRYVSAMPARNNHPPRLVMVGRFYEVKGHDVALQAMHIAREEGLDFQLEFLGDGELRPDMESVAHELGLAGKVYFKGICRDIPGALPAYDIFIMPSRREGLPMAALEAMASYVPVVATRVSGLEEVVEHEVTGLLVPPENPEALARAIIRLLGDESLRHRLALAGRRKVEQSFDLAAQVPKMVELYRQIVASEMKSRSA